jgi:hypothetical protein
LAAEPSDMGRPRLRVVEPHTASFDYSMHARVGDVVAVGREDPDMPGWLWCRDGAGVEAWVPRTHLRVEGRRGVFTDDYNSAELSVAAGEVVQCLGEALGWVECLDGEWRYGWVPRCKLEAVPRDVH